MPEKRGISRKITAIFIGAASTALFILTIILGVVAASRAAVGYYSAFGTASVVVSDEMMNGDGDVKLAVGELATFSVLGSEGRAELMRGDVVLVETDGGTPEILRITSKTYEGAATVYLAKTDAEPPSRAKTLSPDKIIGRFLYKSASNGAFLTFSATFGGYIVCYILPALLALSGIVAVLFLCRKTAVSE